MSGASGAVYGIRMLEVLASVPGVEVHLITTPAARKTIRLETDRDPREIDELADVVHRFGDIAAAPSSGSFRLDAMAVVPCSMRTLSAIAVNGIGMVVIADSATRSPLQVFNSTGVYQRAVTVMANGNTFLFRSLCFYYDDYLYGCSTGSVCKFRLF